MLAYLVVFLGGGIGSILRFLISNLMLKISPSTYLFPYKTLLINLIGAFLIGLFFSFSSTKYHFSLLSHFFVVGVLGGFTTFSAFSLESVNLLEKQEYMLASIYIILSIVGCIASTFLGKMIRF